METLENVIAKVERQLRCTAIKIQLTSEQIFVRREANLTIVNLKACNEDKAVLKYKCDETIIADTLKPLFDISSIGMSKAVLLDFFSGRNEVYLLNMKKVKIVYHPGDDKMSEDMKKILFFRRLFGIPDKKEKFAIVDGKLVSINEKIFCKEVFISDSDLKIFFDSSYENYIEEYKRFLSKYMSQDMFDVIRTLILKTYPNSTQLINFLRDNRHC